MIGIIDYDAGNIKSVEKALLFLGQEAVGGYRYGENRAHKNEENHKEKDNGYQGAG